jgi:3-phosphoshikimate 1-carboxyvinyltransferase
VTAWPDVLTIAPIRRAIGAVRMPGSKSISNRVLLLASLAAGRTLLADLLDADDTRVMQAALAELGVALAPVAGGLQVDGCAGRIPRRAARLFLGNAGTAVRSLTAALAFADGHYELDGVPRMRERPIGDLVDALNDLGARIRYLQRPGFLPLVIEPAHALAGDAVTVRGDVSSQFLSGLLMAAPMVAPATGLRIAVNGALISRPYVDMTIALMRRFGVAAAEEAGVFVVPPATYRAPGRFVVEGDASGASYFLALGAIAGGPVRVDGVGSASVQGDVQFADALAALGARVRRDEHWIECAAPSSSRLRAFDLDLNHIPDAAMTLAVVALFADGPSTLRNIGSWRVKETDRIAAMAAELRKLGAAVEAGADWLRVTPPQTWQAATIDTYDDHRIAMCFALAAAGGVPVRIRNPRCVEKTFPDYFDRLAAVAGTGQPSRDQTLS